MSGVKQARNLQAFRLVLVLWLGKNIYALNRIEIHISILKTSFLLKRKLKCQPVEKAFKKDTHPELLSGLSVLLVG